MDKQLIDDIFQDIKPKKSDLTKFKIMDAFLELVEKTDFDHVKVSGIIQKAGITRSTFYFYFSDIYDLTEYIEDQLISGMPFLPAKNTQISTIVPRSLPTASECLPLGWIQEWFQYIDRFHYQFKVLLGPHGNPQFRNRVKKFLYSSFQTQMDRDGVHHDDLRKHYLDTMTELQLMLLTRYLQDNGSDCLSIDQIIDILNTTRVGGLYLSFLEQQTLH